MGNRTTVDTTIQAGANQTSVLEEFMDAVLVGWSGLRLYLDQRRQGLPADNTMETLLSELLRVNFGENVDARSLIGELVTPRH